MFKESDQHYDIVIIGGGMVGASLAIGLAQLNYRIAVVEAFEMGESQPSYDDRSIALSYGSKQIFESLKLWPALKHHACPIKSIHVSSQGNLGVSRLNATDFSYPALGYVIQNRDMGTALLNTIKQLPQIDYLAPQRLSSLKLGQESNQLYLENGEFLSAKLVIGADGHNSKVAQLLKLDKTQTAYGQTAIIANVSMQEPHQGRAFERFTEHGPIALLPLDDQRMSLVFCVPEAEQEPYMAMNEQDFGLALNGAFGHRLGRVMQVGTRSAYPLSLQYSAQFTFPRTALIGNAAHTVHPVAGQGFNLGLRDIADLLVLLKGHNGDPAQVLPAFSQKRRPDHQAVMAYTNGLIKSFSNANFILGHARGSALLLGEKLPVLKNELALFSMGLKAQHNPMLAGVRYEL